jgi:hypothetical protein
MIFLFNNPCYNRTVRDNFTFLGVLDGDKPGINTEITFARY